MHNNKPVLGITIGDFNGIGPEIILKSLSNKQISKWCTPVIYGSAAIIRQYGKLLNLEEVPFSKSNTIEDVRRGKINVINCWNEDLKIDPGTPSAESGKCAYLSIQTAVKDLKNGTIDALITAPIDKKNIQSDDFKFPGHTEFLLSYFEKPEGLMILTGNTLSVASITGHIALKDVASKVKKERIVGTAKSLNKMLQKDLGIEKPRIAILGLNPHAGDNGLFGNEEEKEIIPAITELKERGILAFGPYGSDGFFGSGDYTNFDGVLGMYHDQVLTPFKLLEFDTGVNYTSGLGVIRTSPDHGTAFDIAGKNKANPQSMLHAIYKALDIIRHRENLI